MFVFSNLAISLDGKISSADRSLVLFGSELDRQHMKELRSECDAILNGAETLRAWRKPLSVPGAEEQPCNVVVSSALKGVSPSWEFFKPRSIRRILIVGPAATAKSLKPFEGRAEIHRLSRPTSRKPIARQILDTLARCGVERLLIEGGGSIMWEFARLNLIDEYHVTLAPKIIGGSKSPTLVDGLGFPAKGILGLKLAQCRIEGDEIFLVYRKIA